jgi:hypothetical protein
VLGEAALGEWCAGWRGWRRERALEGQEGQWGGKRAGVEGAEGAGREEGQGREQVSRERRKGRKWRRGEVDSLSLAADGSAGKKANDSPFFPKILDAETLCSHPSYYAFLTFGTWKHLRSPESTTSELNAIQIAQKRVLLCNVVGLCRQGVWQLLTGGEAKLEQLWAAHKDSDGSDAFWNPGIFNSAVL